MNIFSWLRQYQFDHLKFEEFVFKRNGLPFKYVGLIDEYHTYLYRDLTVKVNESLFQLYINSDLVETVELYHDMENDAAHCFEIMIRYM